MKNIAISGMTLTIDDPQVVATISIIGSPSSKVKAGTGVYKDGLQISVSAITVPSAGATIPDPSPKMASFNSSSQKVKADNVFVLLEGDTTDTISATPQIPGSPPVNYPVSFKVEITAAGQVKAKSA